MKPTRYRKPTAEKLLITGADTCLGANLAISLADRFDVVGLSSQDGLSPDGCRHRVCDLNDRQSTALLIRRQGPQWIVHCGPLARGSWDLPAYCPSSENEPRLWTALAEVAESIHARLTLISTDAVFTGPRMFHKNEPLVTNWQ